jgi:hypothetical protein
MPQKDEQPHKGEHDAFSKIGPRSIEGVEASDLPDAEGNVETNPGREAKRNLPENVGGAIGGQVGMRWHPDIVQSDARGGRKKN